MKTDRKPATERERQSRTERIRDKQSKGGRREADRADRVECILVLLEPFVAARLLYTRKESWVRGVEGHGGDACLAGYDATGMERVGD